MVKSSVNVELDLKESLVSTHYSELVKIHWEIISIKEKRRGSAIRNALRINHPNKIVNLEDCEIIDGRAEMDRV